MPVVQPCQYAAPNRFENFRNFFMIFFEKVGVKSLESLTSLDGKPLLDLLNNLFYYKDFPQNESYNFTSSLFADASMNETTLNTRISKLESIIQKNKLIVR